MKPESEKKLQEWVEQAKRLGLDPNDLALHAREKLTDSENPEPPEDPARA